MAAPVIRKNDIVVVRQGKDKGKTGKVLVVDPDKRRAVVERHQLRQAVHPPRPVEERPGRDHGEGSARAPVAG